MSGVDRKVKTASTVEAIRMASSSVLGTTTSRGYPLGSAIGLGTMMQQNSDTVAMSITPLIFSIRDTLRNAEGLELLSLEWDLHRAPGPQVLPEQLAVAGGSANEVSSHVCVLGWEKGVVDPFKIDYHMKTLAKKISDIEQAVLGNDLDYESEGLTILRRFNDRFNSVIFVEMMDRRFQGSWDSLQVKPENVDNQAVIRMKYKDDFRMRPPGIQIAKRTGLDFVHPQVSEADLMEYFRHRIITPRGLETLSTKIPETGRALLSELNAFAYSIEEADIARVTINQFVEYFGRDSAKIEELDSLKEKINEFVQYLSKTVDEFGKLLEEHISSGKSLTLSNHQHDIANLIDAHPEQFKALQKDLAIALLGELMKSIEREFPTTGETRAWQLKSTIRYFLTHAKNVAAYFAEELLQYLVVTASRSAFIAALRAFRNEAYSDEMHPTEQLLFTKLYAELHSQLNAIFDQKAYEGSTEHETSAITKSIATPMIQASADTDVWSLVEFADVAEIIRTEIREKHSNPGPGGESFLTATGQTLFEILDGLENLVSEIIPDIAEYLTSKHFVSEIIARLSEGQRDLGEELCTAIKSQQEKTEKWKTEAESWLQELENSFEAHMPNSTKLEVLLQFVHNKIGTGIDAIAILEKVRAEAERLEQLYVEEVNFWESECKRIDAENEPIREHNRKREELIQQAKADFSTDMMKYEESMAEYKRQYAEFQSSFDQYNRLVWQYNESMEDYEKLKETVEPGTELPPPPTKPGPEPQAPIEPPQPMPLESRIGEIDSEYPLLEEKPLPLKPEKSHDLLSYVELREIFDEEIARMETGRGMMQGIFAAHLVEVQERGAQALEDFTIGIGDEFLDYLMDSRIRGLGRLLPRTTRAYLKDPKNPDLIFLITYEHLKGELVVAIGNNLLKLQGGIA